MTEKDYARLAELNEMRLSDGALSHADAVLRDERITLQEHADKHEALENLP